MYSILASILLSINLEYNSIDTKDEAPGMGIYKRKGEATDVWYLRYWDADGKLVRRSSGTQDKEEAAAMLAEAEAELARERRAKLEEEVTGAKRLTKPRRFNWRLWTADVTSWDSDTRRSLYYRVLGKRTERPQLTALGEIIATVQVLDREAAVAAGHKFLDEFAGEVRGAKSIAIEINAPEQAVEEERQARLRSFRVSPEAMEQAKALGLSGDIEAHLQGVAFYSEPYAHPRANRRYGNFIIRLEGLTVMWVAFADGSSEPL
jgi:hypothetical protein